MTEIYIVYLYSDYRKEVNIQHLRAFHSRDNAIEFAKKYSDKNNSQQEYVCIHGTEYDANFYGVMVSDDDFDNESDYEAHSRTVKQIKEELGVKKGMWYLRIAVDKVFMATS